METFEDVVKRLRRDATLDPFSVAFADRLDSEDPLHRFRSEFHYPRLGDLPRTDPKVCGGLDKDSVYLLGNSLGLQPKRLSEAMSGDLDRWAKFGGHMYAHGDQPVEESDVITCNPIARLVGASPKEVSVMSALSINLHLLLLSFYRPTAQRYKILCEGKTFPSDLYVFESQARLRGLRAEEVVVTVEPRSGEHCLRHEDILAAIKAHGPQLAVVCFSGVHFFTGQLFDIASITRAAHEEGSFAGWDLAHAVGNVELHLHDWNVDFATWCHYKFVCAGPGAVGGLFLHDKHDGVIEPTLHGWWSHDYSTRFDMTCRMELTAGAWGFRVSCPTLLAQTPVRVAAELILEAGMSRIRAKSRLLTGYLEFLLRHKFHKTSVSERPWIEIITPAEPEQRGAQLSLKFSIDVDDVFREVTRRGVSCDVRRPHILRVAPKPIYNSFADVFRFIEILEEVLCARNGFVK